MSFIDIVLIFFNLFFTLYVSLLPKLCILQNPIFKYEHISELFNDSAEGGGHRQN